MICGTCNREIPNGLLACPGCASARSYQELLRFQRHCIAAIMKGEHAVLLTKSAEDMWWHMALANYPQGWCGRALNTRWKKRHTRWPKIDKANELCHDCRRVFEEIQASGEAA